MAAAAVAGIIDGGVIFRLRLCGMVCGCEQDDLFCTYQEI